MVLALLLSIVVTATVGISAYATRDDRPPGRADRSGTPALQVAQGPEYVAIGDSFTSGGPIGALQSTNDGCQRSSRDYPSLVAHTIGLTLTDVSCHGANTREALAGTDETRAQLAAVTDKAKLVTISLGGNDNGIYVSVFLNCIRYAKANLPGSPCRDKIGGWVASRIPQVRTGLNNLIAAVQARAPEARVMVINYLRILPDDARCDAVPYPSGDVAWVAGVERGLAGAMRQAAANRGVELIDMHQKSEGHDVCSDEPWTNGLRPKLRDGLFLHPNAAGQRAVAQAVTQAWKEGPPERR